MKKTNNYWHWPWAACPKNLQTNANANPTCTQPRNTFQTHKYITTKHIWDQARGTYTPQAQHLNAGIHVQTIKHTHKHTPKTCARTHSQKYTYTCTHACTHKQTHSHMHAHTHTHTPGHHHLQIYRPTPHLHHSQRHVAVVLVVYHHAQGGHIVHLWACNRM